MSRLTSLARIILPVWLMGTHAIADAGVIGKLKEDGLPVIYALELEMPARSEMQSHPWLTLVSWKYDKTKNNGMPEQQLNQRMLKLEALLSDRFANLAGAKWVYNRTGNGLKVFAYYISDRDTFIAQLNHALKGQKEFPIEITFYSDPGWSDIADLVDVFGS